MRTVERTPERCEPAVRLLQRVADDRFVCTTSQLETAAVSHTALAEFDPLVVHGALAEVADLVDAHDSESCGRNPVGVRFPLSAVRGIVVELADTHG